MSMNEPTTETTVEETPTEPTPEPVTEEPAPTPPPQTVFFYAQFDPTTGKVFSISQTSGALIGNVVELESYDTTKLGTIYDPVAGTFSPPPPPPPPTLDEIKAAKIAELNALETEKLKTFQSSALGSPHTYLRATDTKDFSELFNGEFSFLNSTLYDGVSTTLWYTVETGNIPHTKDEFNQVYTDARAHVQSVKYRRSELEAQVNEATTEAEVVAVVWV